MKIFNNSRISNSLKITSNAKYYLEIHNKDDFSELNKFISKKNLPILIIGEGTNLVLPDLFEGIVVKPIFDHINYDDDQNTVSVGSSVNWDDLVNEMVNNNIYGYENLSLIPGSVGAAPIQNIGAYGQEVSKLISSVDCYDYKIGEFIKLTKDDCDFTYRNSIFKNNTLIIYNINFKTDYKSNFNFEYESIKKYISKHEININNIKLKDVSQMITNIRNSTLPNPLLIPNVGSFFKNSIIKTNDINTDKFQLDQLILWDIDSKYVKVGSARLIELIRHDLQKYDNVSIYENHSLVLVTNAKATQEEVLNFAENIKDKVFEVFNISLEIEPTIILN
tara:strand:- start:79 stop:1083 length:1005 start_codon:yes stop_codon:yes gene_type:complete